MDRHSIINSFIPWSLVDRERISWLAEADIPFLEEGKHHYLFAQLTEGVYAGYVVPFSDVGCIKKFARGFGCRSIEFWTSTLQDIRITTSF